MGDGRFVLCWCGKVRPAYVPRGGDGSGMRVRKHRAASGGVCPGTYRTFTEEVHAPSLAQDLRPREGA